MLAYAPMLPYYYYAENYASIIRQGLVSRDKTPEEYHIVMPYNQILKFFPKMSVTSLDYNPVLYSACVLEELQRGAKIVYTVPITPVPH